MADALVCVFKGACCWYFRRNTKRGKGDSSSLLVGGQSVELAGVSAPSVGLSAPSVFAALLLRRVAMLRAESKLPFDLQDLHLKSQEFFKLEDVFKVRRHCH